MAAAEAAPELAMRSPKDDPPLADESLIEVVVDDINSSFFFGSDCFFGFGGEDTVPSSVILIPLISLAGSPLASNCGADSSSLSITAVAVAGVFSSSSSSSLFFFPFLLPPVLMLLTDDDSTMVSPMATWFAPTENICA